MADDGTLDSVDDLLWLISEMPASVSTLDDLLADCADRRIGCTPEALARLVVAGQASGEVEVWHHGAAYVTLTPLAVERMGLRMSIEGHRFFRGTREFPDVYRAPAREGERPDLSIYADPTLPEPLDALVASENDHGDLIGPDTRRLRDGSRVKVRIVLGVGAPWPTALAKDGPCRGCGGRDLPRNAYCAICQRSGVDAQMPPVEFALARDAATTPLWDCLVANIRPAEAAPRLRLKGGIGDHVARKRARGQGQAVA